MEKYTLLKVLGKGSFGAAWLVQSKVDKTELVAKEVRLSGLKPQERESAKNEIVMLRTLHHPNITRYVDHFEHRGSLFIVMEYANGGDLYTTIKQRRGRLLSEKEVLHFFSQTCLALNHLHERRILHRDLKSQNVFLSRDGVVKLGDFGISTVLRNTCELKRTVCGTPYYFSPELCLNQPYNNKSDIWALGCILYELVTLNHAFDGNNMKALVQKILKGVYPPISPLYSQDLAQLIAAMLQIDPHRRPNVCQILEFPFMRASLATLQAQVQVARVRRVSVAPAEEQNRPTPECEKRQEELRKLEQANAARLAELRQQQRRQEQALQERKKQLEDRIREQRRLQEQRAKTEADAKAKRREEQWERNMQKQAEENARRRLQEEQQRQAQQAATKQQQHQHNVAELFLEMRREAMLNKMRAEALERGQLPPISIAQNLKNPSDDEAKIRVSPNQSPPPKNPTTPEHYSSHRTSQDEHEKARAAAFWQMRREAEQNRRRLLGLGALTNPNADEGTISNREKRAVTNLREDDKVVCDRRQDAVSIDLLEAPAGCAGGAMPLEPISGPHAIGLPSSPILTGDDAPVDAEEGYRAFLVGEAAVANSSAAIDKKRDEDYGALDTAITKALQQAETPSPSAAMRDFEDETFQTLSTDPTAMNFMLEGKPLELPHVNASDPLMHRIEVLRMYLEERMGEKDLFICHKAMNSISAEDDDAMQCIAEGLPPSKQKFIPLVAQLIVCEDVFNCQEKRA